MTWLVSWMLGRFDAKNRRVEEPILTEILVSEGTNCVGHRLLPEFAWVYLRTCEKKKRVSIATRETPAALWL